MCVSPKQLLQVMRRLRRDGQTSWKVNCPRCASDVNSVNVWKSDMPVLIAPCLL